MTAVPPGVRARRSREQARVAADVQDQVVVPGAVGEVVPGVVEHVVGAQGPHQVLLGRTGDAGDLRAERLRQLYGVRADTAGGAEHQHRLARLDPAGIGERLQCRAGRDRHDRRLLEGEPLRLGRQLVLPHRGVLGEGAARDAVDLVTHAEAGHRGADGRHLPATSRPGTRFFGRRKPEPEDPHEVGPAGHQVPRPPVEPRRPHPHEHLVVGDHGWRDLVHPQDVGRAVGRPAPPLAWCAGRTPPGRWSGPAWVVHLGPFGVVSYFVWQAYLTKYEHGQTATHGAAGRVVSSAS